MLYQRWVLDETRQMPQQHPHIRQFCHTSSPSIFEDTSSIMVPSSKMVIQLDSTTSADKQMPTKKAEELRCDRPRCQLTTKTQNSLERKADGNEERCNLVHGDDIRHTEEGAKGRAGMIDCQTTDRHATCVTGCCAHLSVCTCKCAAEPRKQQSKNTSPPMPDKLRCAPHAKSETAQDAKSAVSRWTICQNLQAVAAQPFQRATSDLHQTCQKCICDWRT